MQNELLLSDKVMWGRHLEALLHMAAMMSETCCLLLPLYEERLQNIIDAKERKMKERGTSYGFQLITDKCQGFFFIRINHIFLEQGDILEE